jgi:AraC family transcriptional regulator
MEPIAMDDSLLIELDPPRIETGRTLLIAGLGQRYRFETNQGIPQQWEKFAPHIGHVTGQVGNVAYGVCCNSDGAGNFEYVAGVEVTSFDDVPAEFSRVRIPVQRYAVFSHRAHISRMRATFYTIWNKWLPASGYEHADAPDFERYDERFDPRTGNGVVEIWVPIRD